MSDNTPNDTRDASGRFVKQAAETAHRLHTPSEDGVHPISKILFGWTEAEITGTAIFWGVGILSAFLHQHQRDLIAEQLFLRRRAQVQGSGKQ